MNVAKRHLITQLKTSAFPRCPFSLWEKVGMRAALWERGRREGTDTVAATRAEVDFSESLTRRGELFKDLDQSVLK